ncbi:RNAse P Rpr2/Rpp21/SNM1 subunit domain-containing protein [Scheffersomyces coipomensis]|uniref:RNAse P Rpr2/Rpp21/SNM1 subunit domain-containing protein n=1 Tax=Scheffersomyces coipomensis TaxID=1788519 RepID=UPI00315DBC20
MAGSKNKESKSKVPKVVPQKDHYSRISYLLNASNLFSADSKYDILARGYSRNLDLVSKKTVIKLAPALKRSLCKKCNTLLIPGLTMSMSIENTSKKQSPHNDILIHKCISCNTVKRFPVGSNREYVVFSEREDVKITSE